MISAIWVSFLGASSVLCGALGAHVLKSKLSEKHLEIFNTAVLYHQLYALLLVLLFLFLHFLPEAKPLRPCFWFFSIALVLFSGSLYTYLMLGWPFLMRLTPIGGLLLSGAWVFLIFKLL